MDTENQKEQEEAKEESTNVERKATEEKVVDNIQKKNKSTKKLIIIGTIVFIAVIVILLLVAVALSNNKNDGKKKQVNTSKVEYNENTIKGNSLDNFDINFLRLEGKEANMIYSPLSIKYALSMLSDGANGESYNQIKSVIGDYKYKKYVNSANMSLANAMFVRDGYKDLIKEKYVTNLKDKYDAEVVYDSFATPDVINKWINDNTLGLIPKLFDDVSQQSFVLTNALAIDMEWVNKIQRSYGVSYNHETLKYNDKIIFPSVGSAEDGNYPSLKFSDGSSVTATHIRANANRYNIVKELGEDKIRKEVGEAYQKWLDEDMCGNASEQPSVDEYLDKYIKEIDSNYNKVTNSTDFTFYTDDEVKVFGKDLKEYNGTTLQYVAIMPQKVSLKEYIKDLDADKASKLIRSLKEIKAENFKDGVVTDLEGGIPLFKYDYELDLMKDLKSLGISNIFDEKTADLSKMTSEKNAYIGTAKHKATIDFSNDGIKAAAVTAIGGMGAAGCYFTYNYDVPVEKVDLMFDKPYIYFIMDKSSKEVWFTGTVYNPTQGGNQYYVLNDTNRNY